MQAVDFTRSFINFRIDFEKKNTKTGSHKPPYTLNNCRIQVECVCTIEDRDGFNEQFVAESSLPEEELSLLSGATHIVEWFHNEGEYEMKDTRVDFHTEGESDETLEMNQRISYKIAVTDEITGLRELLAVSSELQSPWGW